MASAADSVVIVFVTVPAEARAQALDVLRHEAIGAFTGATAGCAASFVESGSAELRDSELLSVAVRSASPPAPGIAEELWHAVESALFRGGVSAIEHMAAYAMPAIDNEEALR